MRIQILYENGGDAAWFQMMLASDDLSDMLNKAENIQGMYDYDRESLEKYANTVKEIKNLKEKYQQEKNCHFQITHFSDGDEIALGYKGGYDLILMDIEMTFMDGMSAAEEIRRADPEVLIIFITNSPQYAIKGYAVQALDYILKPLSYYAFCQRMNYVRELLGRRQKHFLTVPCAGGVQKLDASDIYYVEICDHDLLFHTKQGEVHSTGSMRDVEQKLPPENFFRSSKAYLVNLEHVDGIQDEDAIVNGERVQISRAKRKAFLAALNHYMGETI